MTDSVPTVGCDREPIHLIGHIQPHGVLIAIDSDARITHASENVSQWFEGGAGPGDRLDRMLGPDTLLDVMDEIQSIQEGERRPFRTRLRGQPVQAWVSRCGAGEVRIIEFQELTADRHRHPLVRPSAVRQMEYAGDLVDLAQQAASTIREAVGFDRVMVYRFHPDDSGEVIAEDRPPHLPAYLGLRYPASDIPSQARRMFVESRVRYLPDIDYQPALIKSDEAAAELDLSLSITRGVAEVHRQYLRNMGVAASLSISLVCRGRLWGLIACHHGSAMALDPRQLDGAELLAQVLSVQVAALEENQRSDAKRRANQAIEAIVEHIVAGSDSTDLELSRILPDVLALGSATGLAQVLPDRVDVAGDTPPEAVMRKLVERLQARGEEGVYSTNEVQAFEPAMQSHRENASGLLAACHGEDSGRWLLWFKPEVATEIHWAGDPGKAAVQDGQGRSLGPRTSFEKWRESVSGRSAEWSEAELAVARELRSALKLSRYYGVRSSRNLQRNLLTSSVDPMFILDGEGQIIAFNSAAEQRLGASHDAGHDLAELLQLGDAGAVTRALDVVRGGQPWNGRHERELGPGQRTIFEVTLTPITGDDRGTLQIACAMRDVTERSRLELQLRQAQKMETVGQLTGGIAHNFNNLLSVMINYADLAGMTLETEHPARKHLAKVKDAGDRAALLLRDLLRFLRNEPHRAATININESVAHIGRMMSQLVRSNIEFDLKCSDTPQMAKIDFHHLEQVLMNLVVNARDAMPQGGQLRISVSELTLSEGDCQADDAQPGCYHRITVRDTGEGISESAMSRIFEPFFTTKEAGKGTGLGLSTCYNIIREAGGVIRVTSEAGTGTEFSILLPDAAAKEHSAARRLVLLEHDASLREAIGRTLQAQGYDVDSFADATTALGAAQTPIDLIVADERLIDNTEQSDWNRLRASAPDTKVLVLFHGWPGTGTATRDVGIHKPFGSRQLLGAVHKWLGDNDREQPRESA